MTENYNELISDEIAFHRLKAECERVIDIKKRFPEFVFQRAFDKYFAIEYAQIYKKEFGNFLFEIAAMFGDESVNYITIEPHPVDYYHHYCSFFGLASFKPSAV